MHPFQMIKECLLLLKNLDQLSNLNTHFVFLLFISVMQSVNGSQFLNTTFLLSLSAAITAASAPAPTTVIDPLTSIYASL